VAGTPDDYDRAVEDSELALALIDLGDFAVRAISCGALKRLGLATDDVVGQPVLDLVRRDDRPAAAAALEVLSNGAVDFYRAHRPLHAPAGRQPLGIEWLHAFEVGEHRLALAEAAHADDREHSPLAAFLGRDLGVLAIGAMNADGVVTAMSTDVDTFLGLKPADLVGRPLLGAVAHRDVQRLLDAAGASQQRSVGVSIKMRNGSGHWQHVCLLFTSLAAGGEQWFILAPEQDGASDAERAKKLEHHLWKIAAEVEASGLLQRTMPVPNVSRLPHMNALTSRQWEVLSRLVRGERVPTIAGELHVSQSTVRNHLGAIFERFGVHSQAELLQVLQSAPGASTGPSA